MNNDKKLRQISQAELQHLRDEYVKDYNYRASHLTSAQKSIIELSREELSTKPIHDVCNIYAYGENTVKIVYIKSGVSPASRRTPKPRRAHDESAEADETRFRQSISRAKAAVFELSLCNEFSYFCTFTQDESKRDRFDIDEFRKDLAMFVRNQNRNRSEREKIKYIMIPEQHKNGAWHIHGLLQGLHADDMHLFTLSEKLPQKIRKSIRAGERVYNWCAYQRSFGYFTATEIKSREATARYITKYVTKELTADDEHSTACALGARKHLYFASQGLKRREVIAHNLDNFKWCGGWDFENEYVKTVDLYLDSDANTLSRCRDRQKLS